MSAVQGVRCKALVCANGALDGEVVEEDLVGHDSTCGLRIAYDGSESVSPSDHVQNLSVTAPLPAQYVGNPFGLTRFLTANASFIHP